MASTTRKKIETKNIQPQSKSVPHNSSKPFRYTQSLTLFDKKTFGHHFQCPPFEEASKIRIFQFQPIQYFSSAAVFFIAVHRPCRLGSLVVHDLRPSFVKIWWLCGKYIVCWPLKVKISMAQMEKINLSRLSRAMNSGYFDGSVFPPSYSVFTIVLAVKQHLKRSALSKHRNLILHAGLQRFRCASHTSLHSVASSRVVTVFGYCLAASYILLQCGLKIRSKVKFWKAVLFAASEELL